MIARVFDSAFILWILLSLPLISSGQGRFVTPVEGVYGKDYIIVNYVDWGAGASIEDNHCLDKTYNGHAGTDYVLKSFSAMDSGLNVLAVDTGVVIFTLDGIFDREKDSDTSKHLGNYVGITHAGNYQTYYGHLKRGSITVSIGDTVLPGQVIGKVGSSGNSSDPHLHFETWYDSLYYIDPYQGPCGNKNSFWKNEIPFDSSFGVWDKGIINFIPTLDTLKEGLGTIDTVQSTDSNLTFWSLQYGLRKNDSLNLKWFTSNDSLWFQFGIELSSNWWYYYFWTYIQAPPASLPGSWKAKLYRNNVLAAEQRFFVPDTSTIIPIDSSDTSTEATATYTPIASSQIQINVTSESIQISASENIKQIKIYNTFGQLLYSSSPNDKSTLVKRTKIQKGVLIVHASTSKGSYRRKIRLE